jgi:hypothetical protein
MNCLMQVLTDRIIHKLELPENVIIAGCINPESANYDVNSMDAALKNRFEEFEVEYDPIGFMDFMEQVEWHDDIQRFVASGLWLYKKPEEIQDDGKYISPRTFEKLESALSADVKSNRILHRLTAVSTLGKYVGDEFHKFSYEESPVTAADLLNDKKAALARLKEHSSQEAYQGGMIDATVQSIIKNYGGLPEDCKEDEIDEATMAEVAMVIPSDQAVNLIKHCGFKHAKDVQKFFARFKKNYPKLIFPPLCLGGPPFKQSEI